MVAQLDKSTSCARPNFPIAREESFGSILSIIPFDGFDEAIAIANGNQCRLASGVHSRDIKKAHKAAAKLKAGTAWVNTYG